MSRLIHVNDPGDPRLADYVQLRDVNLRRSLEAEHGLFIAEGHKVIERALAAGYEPRSALLAPKWLEGLAPLLEPFDVPCYVCSEAMAEAVTGFHVHRGALASMKRENRYAMEDLLEASRLVVCEDIVDHTNVGAIIRCAAGLGWDGVMLAPRAADPLYRRAIKTSMGASLSTPWARLDDWRSGLDRLKEADFTVVAMALREDAVTLRDYVRGGLPDKLALLLGTEGDGLSAHWLSQADVVVRIPMREGIDSLNVAAAAAVACYELAADPVGEL